MEKLFVKRKGTDWDMTAEEVYAAYQKSGMKLNIEFECNQEKTFEQYKSDNRMLEYQRSQNRGHMRNIEMLNLLDALKEGVEELNKHMRWLAYQDDYPARMIYLLSKDKKLTLDEIDDIMPEVFYIRDETFENFARDGLIYANKEITEKSITEEIDFIKKQGFEEITEGLNKGVYAYTKKSPIAKLKEKITKKKSPKS